MILTGMALNLYISVGRTAALTLLRVPTQERGMSAHLLISLIS